MRRVVKIIGRFLSAILLLLIFLPMLLALLLEIPAVQNYVVHSATDLISRKLGTRVSIDRVHLGLFYRVSIDGFYVEDFQRDTLLYAGRLSARVSGFGLLGGGVELARVRLKDGKFCLRETPDSIMNIKEVVNAFVDPNRPEGPGNFMLTIRDLQVDGLDFCMERLEHRNPEYGVDFGNMQLLGIEADLKDFTLDGPNIRTQIERLSFRERSGFEVEEMTGRLFVTSGCLNLEQTHIRTARSDIQFPSFTMVGLDWSHYKYFVDEVDLYAEVQQSTLSSDDVAYFSPKMKDWHLILSGIDASVEGPVANFSATVNSLQVGRRTELRTELSLRGLPDIQAADFDVRSLSVITTGDDINRLMRAVTGKSLAPNVLDIADNAGRIHLNGSFRGGLKTFNLEAAVTTLIGRVDCNLAVMPRGGGMRAVRGRVKTRNLHLNKLLDNDQLGRLSLFARVNGTIGKGTTDAEVNGRISCLEFNGYAYDSLRLNGRISNREFNGLVEARDKNLQFDFSGLLDLNGERPRYDFSLDLQEANLAALGFNRRDSISSLSGRVRARAIGRSLDDLNGIISLRDAVYRFNDQEIHADSLFVIGRNNETDKFIQLRSSFLDATYQGQTSYREVFAYLKRQRRNYIPMLDEQKTDQSGEEDSLVLSNSYSDLIVDLKQIGALTDAILPGLQVADGSQLRLRINPVSDKLTFSASSDYIERGNMLITRLGVNAQNKGDSLVFNAATEDIFLGGLHMSRVGMNGGAKENRFELITDFADTVSHTSGLLGFRSRFAAEKGPDGRQILIDLTPSYISQGEKTWNISCDGITADTARVKIDSFRMTYNGQELLLNGIVSRSLQDSIQLTLHDFDLAPFSNLTSSLGYTVDGRTNGYAKMKSVRRDGRMQADIVIDSIRVNDFDVPALWLRSLWDFARNRAGIIVQQHENLDTLAWGFYAPAKKRYYARAMLDSVNMGALDPILSGVIENTVGEADARITLQGEPGEHSMSGEIRVRDFATTVDFTQVRYTMPAGTISVENNHLIAKDVLLYDPLQNEGRFSLDLNLEHLSNISYSVNVQPQSLLVLNTTSKDNDLFYGKVFASGAATIAGSKGGVRMNIVATTEDQSEFFMPLSSSSSVKTSDFVVFVSPERTDTTDYLVRKKMMFQRKNRKKETVGSSMDISMSLNVKDNTAFQLMVDPTTGNILKGRGNGQLNLHINPQNNVFEMYGDYTLTEGNYLFTLPPIINKRFTLEGGSMIQWTGEPIDARLDITAIYKLKASLQPLLGTTNGQGGSGSVADRTVPVECKLHIGGRLTDPQFSFEVDVPVADVETQAAVASALNNNETKQFMYLLLLGSFASENMLSGNSGLGASTGAATGLELLSNQVSNWFSTDEYRILLNYRPGSEITSDELDFGFSTNLINNRLLVEVEGNYIMDNKQATSNNLSNFMGEAHVTWLIDRSGNLQLKVFTQTIDRFDENQGLQETGLGIVYKEDFNNFKDLKQRILDRFVNRERQERRRARREQTARLREARRQAKAGLPPRAEVDSVAVKPDVDEKSEE